MAKGRPRLQQTKKLLPVPIRLLPETLIHVEKIADTRGWPTGRTIRKMVEEAIRANLVPPVEPPRVVENTENKI